MTNTERQRLFRERNPGYYGRLHRQRKAEVEAIGEARLATALRAAQPVTVPLPLPAPERVMTPAFLFEDRAAIPTPAELRHEREEQLVPVPVRPAERGGN